MIRNLTACFAVVFLLMTACSEPKASAPPAPAAAGTTTASGLTIIDAKEGTGLTAQAGDAVTVQYTGTFKDGTKFDSSYDAGKPFQFMLGKHQVIPGWDEGVAGMKVGGKRQLIIPPNLAYGETGTPGGPIPPNATLYFDIELVDVSR
jgi:peptidylprolyl isomerase